MVHAATAPAGHGHKNWFVGAARFVKRTHGLVLAAKFGKGSAGSGPPESWFPCTWKLITFFHALSDSGRVPVSLLYRTLKTVMSTKALMASGRMPSRLLICRTLHDEQRGRAGKQGWCAVL